MTTLLGFGLPGFFEILILLVIGLPIFVGLGCLIFYLMSASSRKSYACPSCGEHITTEYLEAGYCSKCGTPLQRD